MKLSILSIIILLSLSTVANAKYLNYDKVKDLTNQVLKENNFDLADIKINDIQTFCPNYDQLSINDKNNFFANLVADISLYESSFNTNDIFIENNGSLSVGLLQISFDYISKKYKSNGCDEIKIPDDLKDARKNIKCGLAIIKTLVQSHGDYISDPKKGGASNYWSTLRTPYKVTLKAYNKQVTIGKKYEIISDLKLHDPDCFKK